MRKCFMENLPTKIYKGRKCINWDKSVGEIVQFQYDNINGYFIIKSYDKSINKINIKCSIYNIEKRISPYDFHMCKIKDVINIIYNVSKVIKYRNIANKLNRCLTKKEYIYFNVYGARFNSGLKYLGYKNIQEFQHKNNFYKEYKLKYTYHEIFNNYKTFFNKYDRFPINSDYKNDKNLITKYQVKETLKFNNMSYDDFFKCISNSSYNEEEYEYNKTIDKFKKACIEENRVITYSEVQEKTGHDLRWIQNRNRNIQSYRDLYTSLGFKKEEDLTKEEVKKIIYIMQDKLNRPLMYDDFRSNDSFDTVGIFTVKKHWGTMNKMKKELGLEIIQEDMTSKHKSKDQMIDDIKRLYDKLGRTPTSDEIDNCEYTNNTACYSNYFGGINKVFEMLNIEPNKRSISLHMTNQEIINIYKEFIEDNKITPSYEYALNVYTLPSPSTVMRRFKCTWNEFILMIGYKPNECRYNPSYAKDGTLCTSNGESIVHNYLLTKPILKLNKETYYKDILNNEILISRAGCKRLDWTFNYNNQEYYVEYFGMMGNFDYEQRVREKIELMTLDNKLNRFIQIYPKDLKNLDKVFSFIK